MEVKIEVAASDNLSQALVRVVLKRRPRNKSTPRAFDLTDVPVRRQFLSSFALSSACSRRGGGVSPVYLNRMMTG